MGQVRWSKWSSGADECHAIEFGFTYQFDIRGGPKTNGIYPDFWWARGRDGPLGKFPTFAAAAQACEDEARRLIELTLADDNSDYDAKLVAEQWALYLAMPNRLRSRKARTRYK